MVAVRRPSLIKRIEHVARETNRDTTQVVEKVSFIERALLIAPSFSWWKLPQSCQREMPDSPKGALLTMVLPGHSRRITQAAVISQVDGRVVAARP